jgi:hypothetical protein
MVIGRGRRRNHPKGSRDLRSLRVLRNFRLPMRTPKGTPRGIKWPSVAMLLLYYYKEKSAGKSRACAEHTSGQGHFRQGLFRSGDWCHFRSKGPTRADMGQLPVAHTQNILPDRVTSGHVTDVTSGHVTSGHAQWSDPPQDPPQIRLCPSPYTTIINVFVFKLHRMYINGQCKRCIVLYINAYVYLNIISYIIFHCTN